MPGGWVELVDWPFTGGGPVHVMQRSGPGEGEGWFWHSRFCCFLSFVFSGASLCESSLSVLLLDVCESWVLTFTVFCLDTVALR